MGALAADPARPAAPRRASGADARAAVAPRAAAYARPSHRARARGDAVPAATCCGHGRHTLGTRRSPGARTGPAGATGTSRRLCATTFPARCAGARPRHAATRARRRAVHAPAAGRTRAGHATTGRGRSDVRPGPSRAWTRRPARASHRVGPARVARDPATSGRTRTRATAAARRRARSVARRTGRALLRAGRAAARRGVHAGPACRSGDAGARRDAGHACPPPAPAPAREVVRIQEAAPRPTEPLRLAALAAVPSAAVPREPAARPAPAPPAHAAVSIEIGRIEIRTA